jgi:peptidoglycan/LPS O-acetylase OafA/YrhL
MREIHSVLVKKERLLPGIHGLRGVAALAVVFYHLMHIGGIKPPNVFEFIGRDFGYSVHLFFILSAYSLMYSTEPRINRSDWVGDYLIKRFFRIAPLFYFMMVFEIGRQAFHGGVAVGWSSIVLNLTFTFGFIPFAGIVWGGWAVGVEMIFYAIFPVLLLTIRTHRSALIFLIISIAVSYCIRTALQHQTPEWLGPPRPPQHINFASPPIWDWSYYAFASNICFFAMGIYAFRVRQQLKKESTMMVLFPLIAMALIGWLMFFGGGKYFYGSGRGDFVIWGFGLAALCLWQSAQPSFILAQGLFQYFGERSFSIYLVHPVVIEFFKSFIFTTYEKFLPFIGAYAYFVCAILILAVILIFVELTYRLIEVPGIHLGRRLIVWKRRQEYAEIS